MYYMCCAKLMDFAQSGIRELPGDRNSSPIPPRRYTLNIMNNVGTHESICSAGREDVFTECS